jgi:hypothetical protein
MTTGPNVKTMCRFWLSAPFTTASHLSGQMVPFVIHLAPMVIKQYMNRLSTLKPKKHRDPAPKSRNRDVSENWRERLIIRHPGLYRRTVGSREAVTGFPSVGDGWREIIETMSSRIAEEVAECQSGEMAITQIKEKFGGLRVYTESCGLPKEVVGKANDAIDLAEARAECTCETCGAAGMLHEHAGWLTTQCKKHGVGRVLSPKAGWENLLVKYSAQDGAIRVVSCRRYDRERDAFEDVPVPLDLENDEEDGQ